MSSGRWVPQACKCTTRIIKFNWICQFYHGPRRGVKPIGCRWVLQPFKLNRKPKHNNSSRSFLLGHDWNQMNLLPSPGSSGFIWNRGIWEMRPPNLHKHYQTYSHLLDLLFSLRSDRFTQNIGSGRWTPQTFKSITNLLQLPGFIAFSWIKRLYQNPMDLEDGLCEPSNSTPRLIKPIRFVAFSWVQGFYQNHGAWTVHCSNLQMHHRT